MNLKSLDTSLTVVGAHTAHWSHKTPPQCRQQRILPACRQVPCDLPSEYPALWPGMLELLRSLVQAATPFMQHQASPNHFEFLGLDIIADRAGGVWLMEGEIRVFAVFGS